MIKIFSKQTTEERRNQILHGPILNTLLMLSAPTLLMGLVMSLMPLMDGIFLNNVAGSIVASSVTFSEPIIMMMTALSQGLGIAGMAIIGQHNGLGDFDIAKKISVQIIVFAVILGLFMGPTLYVTAFIASQNLDPAIKDNVFLYLSSYSFVMPLTFLASIYNAIKNANGKPEATLIRMIMLLILKLLFNFVYVYFMGLGIIGSVLSSFSTYSIVTIWMYYDLFIKNSEDKLTLKGFKFNFPIIKDITVIGIPSMIATFLTNLGFVLINTEIQKYGPIVLNGQGIAGNVVSACFNVPSSFSSAVTTMVSMNIGAKYIKNAKKTCLMGCILAVITAIILTLTVIPLSPYITKLFTRNKEVLEVANQALPIYASAVAGFGICMVIQGTFIGLGQTKIPLILSFLRIWLFRYLFVLATGKFLGYYAVFWGNLFSNYMAAIVSIILILRANWESVINIQSKKRTFLSIKNWFVYKKSNKPVKKKDTPKKIDLKKTDKKKD